MAQIRDLTDDELAWCKNPTFGGEAGLSLRRLASAVLEEAVTDLKLLRRNGVVTKNGCGYELNRGIVSNGRLKRKYGNYRYPSDVIQLLEFLQPGGRAERWIVLSSLSVSQNVMQRI